MLNKVDKVYHELVDDILTNGKKKNEKTKTKEVFIGFYVVVEKLVVVLNGNIIIINK